MLFSLQNPPTCKWFELGDVDPLLSLLKRWTAATSLYFKVSWKTATVSALFHS